MNYHNKVVIKDICYKFHIKSELFTIAPNTIQEIVFSQNLKMKSKHEQLFQQIAGSQRLSAVVNTMKL